MDIEALLESAAGLRSAYAEVDWASTPLGPVSSWSPALANAVDLALHTQFPVTLFWGPEFALVYNAAYISLIADKHPSALGTPARDVFPEAWDTIGPMMASVLAGDGATWVEDAFVPLVRHGVLEEAYFTFSYSPVRGPDGEIEGVMDIAAETTRQVVDRRRLATLSRLREELADVEREQDVAASALPVLRDNERDLPGVELRSVAPRDGATALARDPDEGIIRVALNGSAPSSVRVELVVGGVSAQLASDAAYLRFLELIASSLGHAIDRLRAGEAERAIAEALQRSLLTAPPRPEHLQVAVRYRPAAEHVRVGGDWYDAFLDADGALVIAIGDVTGHDQKAAASMAQIRNLLRGIAYAHHRSPAEILSALDAAMHGLGVEDFATVVLGRIDSDASGRERAPLTLRWSNAGHPAPIIVSPRGDASLLTTPPAPLLGLGADEGRRADHTVDLEPGSTVVFYTDGLVERRSVTIDERLAWLTRVLEHSDRLDAEAVCEHLLAHLPDSADDDVALLVLRVHPEDRPTPPAGSTAFEG